MSGKDGGWILPEVIDPDRVCVKLFIPNDPAHIAAFWGALWNLTYWNQWQRDPLKQGTQVAKVWKDVWLSAVALNTGMEGCDIVPFDVRQNEENPCILEKTEDGGATWVTFAVLDDCATPFDIRQNPTNPCLIEKTTDGGATWEVIYNSRLCPPLLQYIDGVLNTSDDGGETWTPVEVEEYDPVYETPPPPRPRPEEPDGRRCSAADSAAFAYVSLAKKLAAIMDNVGEIFFIAGDWAGVLESDLNFFIGGNFFDNLSSNLAFQANAVSYITALSLSATAATEPLNDYFREHVGLDDTAALHEGIRCALYCVMDEDGIVSFGDADAAIEGADLPSAFLGFFRALGSGGFNAAIGAPVSSLEDSDCEECECPDCAVWDFTVNDGGFSPYSNGANYTSSVGWEAFKLIPSNGSYMQIEREFSTTTITGTQYDFAISGTWNNVIGASGCATWLKISGVWTKIEGYTLPAAGGNNQSTGGLWTDVTGVRFDVQLDGYAGLPIPDITCTAAIICWSGANPFD